VAGVAEDADLGLRESGLPQDRADLLVAVVCPEVQDVAGQDEVGGRLGGNLLDIAGDQSQAAG